jgi:hypothetical protein
MKTSFFISPAHVLSVMQAWRRVVLPAVSRHAPELIVVRAAQQNA